LSIIFFILGFIFLSFSHPSCVDILFFGFFWLFGGVLGLRLASTSMDGVISLLESGVVLADYGIRVGLVIFGIA